MRQIWPSNAASESPRHGLRLTDEQQQIRDEVPKIGARFADAFWLKWDRTLPISRELLLSYLTERVLDLPKPY